MRKLLVLGMMMTSFGAWAGVTCSGSGVSIRANSSEMKISGDYSGTVSVSVASGDEYIGSSVSGNIKSATLIVDGEDSELTVITSSGRSDTLSVDCN